MAAGFGSSNRRHRSTNGPGASIFSASFSISLELLHGEQTVQPGRALDALAYPLEPLLELVRALLQQPQVLAHALQLAGRIAQVAPLAEVLARDKVELLELLLGLFGRVRALQAGRITCPLACHLAKPLATLFGKLLELPRGPVHLAVDGNDFSQAGVDDVLPLLDPGAILDAYPARPEQLLRWLGYVVRAGHENGRQLQMAVEQLQRALDRLEKGKLGALADEQMESFSSAKRNATCHSSAFCSGKPQKDGEKNNSLQGFSTVPILEIEKSS
uniref:Uncharacterized protein n=1 Tax=Anopheles atroparvus TaxID=41427 RepID=A0A182JEP2_ANOAO